MPNNHLTVTLRKFYREKLYSLINLAGLSIAIASCLILGLYLQGELTYDQHNLKSDRIYRVVNEYTSDGSSGTMSSKSSPVLGMMMAEEYPEIEQWAMLAPSLSSLYRHEEDAFYWKAYATNERIFDIFTHDVIYGDPKTALLDGAELAVSETFAKKYFGDVNPIGKIVVNEVGNPLTISLVFADLPENSHLQYDALIPTNRAAWVPPENIADKRQWLFSTRGYTYFLMSEDFEPNNFQEMASAFYQRHMEEQGRELEFSARFWLEPLTDIHYQSNLMYDEPTGNQGYLNALIAVSLFILLVACINYINLATARSLRQAKTVGVRKILGASKNGLVIQFMAEAILLVFISMLLAVVLVEIVLTLTPINELFGKNLCFSIFQEPQMLVWFGAFSVIVGLLAGIYPALYLSSWAPLSGLISDTVGSKVNFYFRKLLVLTQFAVTVAVVACTLLMSNQIRFISDKSLGFDKENRIVIKVIGRELISKLPLLEEELVQYPQILETTTSVRIIGKPLPLSLHGIEGNNGVMVNRNTENMSVAPSYISAMGMEIVQGRDFSEDLRTDQTEAYIVNQAFVDTMGWDNPLGKRIGQATHDVGKYNRDGRVVGVTENFHFKSLHQSIEPLIIMLQQDEWETMVGPGSVFESRYVTVNVTRDNIRQTIGYLQDKFQKFDPIHPFEFEFLDESIDQLYQSEQNMMKLISIFAGLCIFIACLGLFGLSSFTTDQRSKEIGIRKVLGASPGQIIYLLSKSTLLLVLIGAMAGCVVAYFAIDYWLGNFSYRADMTVVYFLIATLSALLIAYATVALQSFKIAQADPVETLRRE